MPDEEVKKPEAPAKEDEKPPEHMIPKSRFDEVNKRAQAYERFGSPEQVTAALNALTYYQELERQAVEEASQRTSGEATDATAKKLAEARAALHEVDPELADAKKQAKVAFQWQQAQENRVREEAADSTRDLLAEAGIETDDATVTRYGKQLAQYFNKDDNPRLHRLFWINPEKAVQQAWKLWQADVAKGLAKSNKEPEDTTRKLPRAPSVPSGSASTGKAPPEPAGDHRTLERTMTAKLKAAAGGK